MMDLTRDFDVRTANLVSLKLTGPRISGPIMSIDLPSGNLT